MIVRCFKTTKNNKTTYYLSKESGLIAVSVLPVNRGEGITEEIVECSVYNRYMGECWHIEPYGEGDIDVQEFLLVYAKFENNCKEVVNSTKVSL